MKEMGCHARTHWIVRDIRQHTPLTSFNGTITLLPAEMKDTDACGIISIITRLRILKNKNI